MVHKLTAAVLLAALLAGCSEGGSGDGTKEEAGAVEETASPGNVNGQQPEGGKEDQVGEHEKNDEPIEQSAEEMAKSIVKALENENYGAISEYVSKEKGLLISPYEFIESDAVVLSNEEMENLSSIEKEYLWGYHDGSGKPIRSVPQAYFDRYKGFTEPDQIILDDVQQRGNTKNNIKEVFPDSKTVEFYQNGTDKYGGMDWRSLYLVFQQDAEGKLKLSALVTGEWTI
ncbi:MULTISPECIES: hypothetical protein [Bacillaceae]|uniref:hypothetical protein n=1 Tax=Bacillaceae TaxID=186817 RepID=UPI001CD36FDF|nr:hypothetical protein [Bacillus infantis]MCA1037716.1 hypothetical protein [Bacillus infantis]MDW2876034.1 hypothetical protein [Bacillus infantis]